jgi:hypothetical protein
MKKKQLTKELRNLLADDDELDDHLDRCIGYLEENEDEVTLQGLKLDEVLIALRDAQYALRHFRYYRERLTQHLNEEFRKVIEGLAEDFEASLEEVLERDVP